MNNQKCLLTTGLEETILYQPAELSGLACDSLKIITGFTDCERISTHLIKLKDGIEEKKYPKNMTVEIILGMTRGAGLTEKKHQDIRRCIKYLNSAMGMPLISCRYINTGANVHSKIYIWSQGKDLKIAYCGSANYSIQAFQKRRESMTYCDPASALKYFDDILADSIDCNDPELHNKIKFSSRAKSEDYMDDPDNADYDYYDKQKPVDSAMVSLCQADGNVGHGSGINWGIRPNGTPRNRNQAYIPYNAADKKPGFFPDRVSPDDKNCPVFRVITKRYGTFHMRMAQERNKALHSAESNALLGMWIRDELGLPSGTFVTLQDLRNKHKTKAYFRKYADGTYLLDLR